MQFKEGADVYTSTGEKAGDIDRVVIDPLTDEVTHLVVRKGFLFPEDRVVPVDLIYSATEERVTLRDVEDIEDLPVFETTQYIPANQLPDTAYHRPGYVAPYYWYSHPGAMWWGAGPYPLYPPPPYVTEVRRNIPEGTVPLKEGAKVITSDDEVVGNIERIFAEPSQDRATHLLISQGLLLKERKVVPTSWIMTVMEDEVHLGVSSDLIEGLPEYEEA